MATFITSKDQCLEHFQSKGIQFTLHQHQSSPSIQDMQANVKFTQGSPFIKNLFYSDKKDNYYLVLAESNTKVEKVFWKHLGTSSGNVRLCNENKIDEILKVSKGTVTPFALLNDHNSKVKYVVIDQKLKPFEYWGFHPLDNSYSVEIKQSDILAWLKEHNKNSIEIDLEQTEIKDAPKKEEQLQQQQPENLQTLAITVKKSENFGKWYQQVITKAELIEYYDVSGCYILRPWAFSIWEKIQEYFNSLIIPDGVENSYFPLFVSQKALTTEKDHVEGFAPEVAWVTKYGTSDLKEPVAVRPTSETIMYPAYSKWIKGHRDLPLKLNQWTNVVRWEFKFPTPFLRTREFLWQEGHTAHATREEADDQTYRILGFYEQVYKELLAVPVIQGIKTESEKFAGGFYTTTVETVIPNNGRGIQAATSHQLGQNFSKMFHIVFEDQKKEKQFVWQTSWGLTTRSIGIMIMFHGDDQGLVLPPRVAKFQVVIVPLYFKGKEEEMEKKAKEIAKTLIKAGVRVHVDDRDNYNPGWKYNHWEQKGVPIRLELGPKDYEKDEVRLVRRVDNHKRQISVNSITQDIPQELLHIHELMYQKAVHSLQSKQAIAHTWQEFMKELNLQKVVTTPWCKDAECEKIVKVKSGTESKEQEEEQEGEGEGQKMTGAAKTLCMPLKQDPIKDEKCFHCGKPALTFVIWGRSY